MTALQSQPTSTPNMSATAPTTHRASTDNATLVSTASRSSIASLTASIRSALRLPLTLRGGCFEDLCECLACCGLVRVLLPPWFTSHPPLARASTSFLSQPCGN